MQSVETLMFPSTISPSRVVLLMTYDAKLVRQWIKENADKIAVSNLPNCSPDFTPDVLLNAISTARRSDVPA